MEIKDYDCKFLKWRFNEWKFWFLLLFLFSSRVAVYAAHYMEQTELTKGEKKKKKKKINNSMREFSPASLSSFEEEEEEYGALLTNNICSTSVNTCNDITIYREEDSFFNDDVLKKVMNTDEMFDLSYVQQESSNEPTVMHEETHGIEENNQILGNMIDDVKNDTNIDELLNNTLEVLFKEKPIVENVFEDTGEANILNNNGTPEEIQETTNTINSCNNYEYTINGYNNQGSNSYEYNNYGNNSYGYNSHGYNNHTQNPPVLLVNNSVFPSVLYCVSTNTSEGREISQMPPNPLIFLPTTTMREGNASNTTILLNYPNGTPQNMVESSLGSIQTLVSEGVTKGINENNKDNEQIEANEMNEENDKNGKIVTDDMIHVLNIYIQNLCQRINSKKKRPSLYLQNNFITILKNWNKRYSSQKMKAPVNYQNIFRRFNTYIDLFKENLPLLANCQNPMEIINSFEMVVLYISLFEVVFFFRLDDHQKKLFQKIRQKKKTIEHIFTWSEDRFLSESLSNMRLHNYLHFYKKSMDAVELDILKYVLIHLENNEEFSHKELLLYRVQVQKMAVELNIHYENTRKVFIQIPELTKCAINPLLTHERHFGFLFHLNNTLDEIENILNNIREIIEKKFQEDRIFYLFLYNEFAFILLKRILSVSIENDSEVFDIQHVFTFLKKGDDFFKLHETNNSDECIQQDKEFFPKQHELLYLLMLYIEVNLMRCIYLQIKKIVCEVFDLLEQYETVQYECILFEYTKTISEKCTNITFFLKFIFLFYTSLIKRTAYLEHVREIERYISKSNIKVQKVVKKIEAIRELRKYSKEKNKIRKKEMEFKDLVQDMSLFFQIVLNLKNTLNEPPF